MLQFDQNRHLVAPKLLSNNNLSSATTICGKCTGSVLQTRSGLYWLCLTIGQVIVMSSVDEDDVCIKDPLWRLSQSAAADPSLVACSKQLISMTYDSVLPSLKHTRPVRYEKVISRFVCHGVLSGVDFGNVRTAVSLSNRKTRLHPRSCHALAHVDTAAYFCLLHVILCSAVTIQSLLPCY